MASSTINGTTANANIVSKIEWSSTPSTAHNNSTVTASLYYKRTNIYSGTPTSGTGSFSITIDGQKGSTSAKLTVPNDNSWVRILTVTKTVAHNTDGKKSITISATGSITGTSLSSTSCSGTATLDNIPRQATLVSAPNFTDEQNPTITYSNPAGNAVTSLEACISIDRSTSDIEYRAISKSGSTYQFKLTDAERNVLRNATTTGNSRTVFFYVRTVIGGVTYHSRMEKTLTIVNANPTYSADELTYADMDSAVVAITGNNQQIVQGKSYFAVGTGNATGKKGASIVQYNIELNGVTREVDRSGTYTMGVINSSTDVDLIVTAVDSRGNKTTAKKKVTMLAWSPPVINATVERLNNYEDETYLKVNATMSSVNGKNDMVISYEKRQVGGDDFAFAEVNNNTQYTIVCDKNYAYIFTITVSDMFATVEKVVNLARGMFPLFIDTKKNAVGVNEFPQSGEALRVAGGVGTFEDGIVLMSPNKSFKITINDSGALVITELK